MAIYTFSTKAKRPLDTEAVEQLKEFCEEQGLNFSSVVVKLIKEWSNEQRESS